MKNTNEFGVLWEIELHDFQKENDIELPDGYKSFLAALTADHGTINGPIRK